MVVQNPHETKVEAKLEQVKALLGLVIDASPQHVLVKNLDITLSVAIKALLAGTILKEGTKYLVQKRLSSGDHCFWRSFGQIDEVGHEEAAHIGMAIPICT